MTAGSRSILVWARHGRDATLAIQVLAAHGLTALAVASADELVARIPDAGCAVITTEMVTPEIRPVLAAALAAQPPWSDFPIILFAANGAGRAAHAAEAATLLGNVTVLERPVRSRTLISAVSSALRARRRQYDAREAIARRDQFLAMLGHELRNPLAAIVLAIEALQPVCGELGARPRAVIERQAAHLTRLVDDLLDVARVTSGKVLLRRAPIDLTAVLRRCVDGVELAARDRGIALRVELPAEPLLVDGDLVRLEEIFGNLIANALKYTGPRGVIELTARRDGAHCVIEIADTGVGIAPEMLDRIFELFSQADEELDRSQGGLGIGLTLVRALVELHGGTVGAASAGLGAGSRFTVRLPRLSADALPAPTAGAVEPPDPTEPTELRVVVVDDNLDLLELTRDVLIELGCAVETACDGVQGIELILAAAPDVAFVDIGLPRVDGYEVARTVARDADRRPLLIAVSGYGQPEDRQRAHDAGFDQHLTKPLTTDAMQAVLDTCRRRRDAPRAPAP